VQLLTLIGICFVGGLFWVANAEATAILYGAQLGWNPLLVGIVSALSQCAMYTLLFWGGDWLIAKWTWLGRKVEKTRARFKARLDKSYLTMTATGALVGLPPMTVMALLAGGFNVRLRTLLAIAFGLRFVRFTVLAAVGTQLQQFWSSIWN
jgi:membrane protein YqaA with SNARE-associated domain